MAAIEIGLVARAKGLGSRFVPRQTLEAMARAEDLPAFLQSVYRAGTVIEPIGERTDVFAVEDAIRRTASGHLATLHRWQERMPGVLDVFAAHQDRRSLRALLRGAAAGTAPAARLRGLLPTWSLPVSALSELARQSSPSTLVRQLVVLAHPEGVRLLPLARTSQIDLLAVDVTLLTAFAERARQAAQHGDQVLRDFVGMLIDAGNAENALLIAGEPAVSDGPSLFVRGGRWFPIGAFLAVARAGSYAEAVTRLAAVNARSTLALSEAASPDVARVDRTFVVNLLEWLARASRIDPLSTAPLLRVLMLVEAQSRDLRALAWGAVLGTPPSLRLQQLVTPA